MDDRKFLEKIRQLQKNGKKISLTEIEDTKLFKKERKLLFEDDNNLNMGDTNVIDSDIQNLEPDEQREEENNFKNITKSKLVRFNPIKVHKENVEWSGYLIREKIQWTFSLDDKVGCYIQSLNDESDLVPIQLTDSTLEVLKKLRAYYDIWSDEWSSRLTGGPNTEGETTTSPETAGGTETTGENPFGF